MTYSLFMPQHFPRLNLRQAAKTLLEHRNNLKVDTVRKIKIKIQPMTFNSPRHIIILTSGIQL